MKNAIFTTFDDKYIKHAKDFFKSLELNYPDHPEVIISYYGKKASVLKMLSKVKNSKLFSFNNNFIDLRDINLGILNSQKVYFKYILWTNAFDDYDTIVHIDIDVLILQPFDELFFQNTFFCISDFTPFGLTLFKNEFYKNKKLKKLLLEDNIDKQINNILMMNAGVFVMPRKYRTPEQFNLLWNITKRYNSFTDYSDQAAISLWCYCNEIIFSPNIEYNFQLSFFINPFVFFSYISQNKLSMNAIKIIHYTWWKKETTYYKKLIEISVFIDNLHSLYID